MNGVTRSKSTLKAQMLKEKTRRMPIQSKSLNTGSKKMRKLTGISEQLKTKNCRTVYNVLLASSTGSAEQSGRPKDKIYLATSKWKSIELRVTEALNEAKDNVKYL